MARAGRVVAGIDIGNSTTEAVLLEKLDGESRYLAGAMTATTGVKGTPDNAKGCLEVLDEALRAAGLASIRLVLTSFEFREASRRERSGILEIIDASSLRAIGAVPFDREMLLAQEKGALPTGRSAALQAYDNIAARLCGEDTKLFYKIRGISSGRAL